jgi:hypothetical protein
MLPFPSENNLFLLSTETLDGVVLLQQAAVPFSLPLPTADSGIEAQKMQDTGRHPAHPRLELA